jgi:hypothetical protein
MKLLLTLVALCLYAPRLVHSAPAIGEKRDEMERRQSHAQDLMTRRDPIDDLIEIVTGIYVAIEGSSTATTTANDIINAISTAFDPLGAENPWQDSGNCLLSYSTHGGVDCSVTVTPADSSGNSTATTHDNDWNVCPWTDFSQPPPVQYWTDPGIGDYSIRFTATDTNTWNDPSAPNTVNCVAQGLCNAQLTFYHDVTPWSLTLG